MGKPVTEKTEADSEAEARREPQPYRVRLPGFLGAREEVGLGQAVKRATSRAGIRPCGGCLRRAAALDPWIRFTR